MRRGRRGFPSPIYRGGQFGPPLNTRKTGVGKPPKLRFQAGSFVRNKKTGELFCIRVTFRTIDEPTFWKFVLEERDNTDPHVAQPGDRGKMDTLLVLHEAVVGKDDPTRSVTITEPLRSSMEWHEEDLLMNSSLAVSNQTLLNDYEVVSSGETLLGEGKQQLNGG